MILLKRLNCEYCDYIEDTLSKVEAFSYAIGVTYERHCSSTNTYLVKGDIPQSFSFTDYFCLCALLKLFLLHIIFQAHDIVAMALRILLSKVEA